MDIKLSGIDKCFGKVQILYNISLELTPGIYGFLGPNGAGKSTLMNIIANISVPTRGQILWNHKDIKESSYQYRSQLGYLPQDVGLYAHFTAREFLRYIAALKNLNKNIVEHRIDELAEVVNISNVLSKKCGKLSGGMKRRLGLAGALLNDPKLLILDEPTAGLYPMERIRFRNMISELSVDKIVILSTHIVSDIDRIANQVMMIEEGKIINSASVESIIDSMRGRVWELEVLENEFSQLEKKLKVSGVKHQDNKILMRVISDISPTDNSVSVIPTLEDVYMVFFKEASKEGLEL